MASAFRSSVRHEIREKNWIPVRIRKRNHSPEKESENLEESAEDVLEGHIVDISTNGIKIRSTASLSFHEQLVLEVLRTDGEPPICVAAEVHWTQPDSNRETWSSGCIIDEQFPDDYISFMARHGILERRHGVREMVHEPAVSRWESSTEEIPIVVCNVSTTGLGFISSRPIEVGRRVQIVLDDSGRLNHEDKFTVRAVRQTETEDGFFVGCKVLRGSTHRLLGEVISARERKKSLVKGVFYGLNIVCLVALIIFLARQILVDA